MIRIREAAELLGVSARHARRWIGAHLRATLVAGALWVSRADVERLVERRQVGRGALDDRERAVAAVRALARGAPLAELVVELGLAPDEAERLASWYAAASGAELLAPDRRARLAAAAGLDERASVDELERAIARQRAELLRALSLSTT